MAKTTDQTTQNNQVLIIRMSRIGIGGNKCNLDTLVNHCPINTPGAFSLDPVLIKKRYIDSSKYGVCVFNKTASVELRVCKLINNA